MASSIVCVLDIRRSESFYSFYRCFLPHFSCCSVRSGVPLYGVRLCRYPRPGIRFNHRNYPASVEQAASGSSYNSRCRSTSARCSATRSIWVSSYLGQQQRKDQMKFLSATAHCCTVSHTLICLRRQGPDHRQKEQEGWTNMPRSGMG